MNFEQARRLFAFRQIFRSKSKTDPEILCDLLECGLDDQELKQTLKIDLNDEKDLRAILAKKQFGRYARLTLYCDKRQALRVVLTSQKLANKLRNELVKTLAYPLLLFSLSLIMLVFVNGLLLKTFKSVLSFLGPQLDLGWYQSALGSIICLDIMLIFLILFIVFLYRFHKLQFYLFLRNKWPKNQWQQLISYQFCQKFIHFYHLGGHFDQIFRQIQWSSDPILTFLCATILTDLEEGKELAAAISTIDTDLHVYFRMSAEGMDIETYLLNHNRIQELLILRQIKNCGKVVLGYSYLKIAVIIVVIYQMMLKPIEMMGNYL